MRTVLLCVGGEKCGTTWLHNYFASHPGYRDVGKELNAIARDDFVPNFVDNHAHRANIDNYFDDLASGDLVTGDFTHYEGSTANIFKLIREGFAAKNTYVVPVYIMRDPIERAWSAWKMFARAAGSTDFSYQMSPAAKFIAQRMIDCKYMETVLTLDRLFDEPLYFFYETFFQQENLDKICDRLGLERHQADFTVINKGPDIPVPEDFKHEFARTPKNVVGAHFALTRFKDIPWNINDYRSPIVVEAEQRGATLTSLSDFTDRYSDITG